MTTAHGADGGSTLKKNLGRWGLLASMAAVALFGARRADAAATNVKSITIGTQSSTDCVGTTNTTITFPVTVAWNAGTGSPTATLAITSALPSGVTSQSISPTTITFPATTGPVITFTITSPDAEVAQSNVPVTVQSTSPNTINSTGGKYTVNANPTAAAGVDKTTCLNSGVALAASPAGTGNTGLWTIVTGGAAGTFSDATKNNATFTPTNNAGSTTTLRWTVTTTNTGCTGFDDMIVTVNALPATPTITPSPSSVCASSTGNQASGPAGATTYAWTISNGTITLGAATQTVTYTAGASGSVTLNLTVTNASNCSASNSALVTINPKPTASASGTTSICTGGSTPLSGSGGVSCSWSPATGLDNASSCTPSASPSSTTTYNLTVTDANGCTSTNAASATITVNSIPTPPGAFTTSSASVCQGDSNVAYSVGTSSTGSVTYHWTYDGTGATFAQNDTGAASNTHVSFSASATSGTLHVTAVKAGCSSTEQTFAVTVNSNPTPTITPGSSSVCSGSTGNTASGPAGATTYAWTITNGTITAGASSQNVTYTAGGSGNVTLKLIVTYSDGCTSAQASTLVPINANPTATAGANKTTCLNAAVALAATAPGTGNTGLWTITTVGATGTFSDATSPTSTFTPTNDAGTTVVLTWTVTTTGTGCKGSDTMNVVVAAAANAGADKTTCLNQAVTLAATAAGGGSTGAWSIVTPAATGTFSDATKNNSTFTPTSNNGGTITLRWTVTLTATGCTTTDDMIVTVNTTPTGVNAGVDMSTCLNQPVTLAATAAGAGETGTWSLSGGATGTFSDVNSPTSTFTPTNHNNSTSTLVWTVQNNTTLCTASDTMVVTVLNTPNANGGPDKSTCLNTAVALSGGPIPGGTTGTWTIVTAGATGTFSDIHSQTSTFTPTSNGGGTITIRWTLVNNTTLCSDSDDVIVTVHQTPTASASITGNSVICRGASTTLLGTGDTTGAYHCSWSPSTGLSNANSCTPTASPTTTTTYTLTLSDHFNCPASNSPTVTVPVDGSIAVAGNTEFCADDTGGIATAITPATGTVQFQWGYRTVSGGVITDLPGHTGSSYTLQGSDFPGAATYYLVCTLYITGTECNAGSGTAKIVSNEVTLTVDPACEVAKPPDVQFLTLTTKNATSTNILQWLNSETALTNTQLRARTDGTYPQNGADGTLVSTQSGAANTKVTFNDTGVSDGTTYSYTLFGFDGTNFSVGKNVSGTPFSLPATVKWAFSSAGITLAPPALLSATNSAPGALYAVTNAREIHSMNVGSSGGDWPTYPSTWLPFRMNGPSADRAVPLTFSTYTVQGVKTVLFATSMDGSAYAINSRTGAFLWNGTFPTMSDFITGAPGGIFQEFNTSITTPNSLFVGGNCFSTGGGCTNPGRSTLVALDPNTGAVQWSYDGSADALQIGTISGQPQVENSTSLANPHRVFFASRSLAGGPTVWALDASTGAKLWGSTSVGDVDTQVNRSGATLYVGNLHGKVYALDHGAGSLKWSGPGYFDSGIDSPVKAIVTVNQGRLFFSVGDYVYAVTDGGASPSAYWATPTNLPSPTSPTVVNGGPFGTFGKAYVGTGDGRVCEIDVATQAVKCLQVGPTNIFQVGRTTFDNKNSLLYVGSEPGQVYAIALPLP